MGLLLEEELGRVEVARAHEDPVGLSNLWHVAEVVLHDGDRWDGADRADHPEVVRLELYDLLADLDLLGRIDRRAELSEQLVSLGNVSFGLLALLAAGLVPEAPGWRHPGAL